MSWPPPGTEVSAPFLQHSPFATISCSAELLVNSDRTANARLQGWQKAKQASADCVLTMHAVADPACSVPSLWCPPSTTRNAAFVAFRCLSFRPPCLPRRCPPCDLRVPPRCCASARGGALLEGELPHPCPHPWSCRQLSTRSVLAACGGHLERQMFAFLPGPLVAARGATCVWNVCLMLTVCLLD